MASIPAPAAGGGNSTSTRNAASTSATGTSRGHHRACPGEAMITPRSATVPSAPSVVPLIAQRRSRQRRREGGLAKQNQPAGTSNIRVYSCPFVVPPSQSVSICVHLWFLPSSPRRASRQAPPTFAFIRVHSWFLPLTFPPNREPPNREPPNLPPPHRDYGLQAKPRRRLAPAPRRRHTRRVWMTAIKHQ